MISFKIKSWLRMIYKYPKVSDIMLMHKLFLAIIPGINCMYLFGVLVVCVLNMWWEIIIVPIALLSWLIPFAIISHKKRDDLADIGFIGSLLCIATSFFAVLYLGGLVYSCGMFLLGLWGVMMSLLFPSRKRAAISLIIYSLSIIIAFYLEPWLSVKSVMYTEANIFFIATNAVYIGIGMILIMDFYLTERIQSEQREMKRISEIDQLKTTLYTNISHEFRTPITLILGMVDKLNHIDKTYSTELQIINNSGRKLLRLVNQMLNLSKIESGLIELNNIQSDIVTFLEFIIKTYIPVAETKNIKLSFSPSIDYYLMDFDPEKLEEIMANLISNAIKQSVDNGKIDIILNIISEQEPHISIVVKDKGSGIPPDKLDKIFDRFYQVEENFNHHKEGTGIGLSLVKENIKIMGGEISVQSNLGIGTTFVIKLPVSNHAVVKNILEMPEESTKEHYDFSSDWSFQKDQSRQHSLPVLLIIEDHPEMISYIKSLVEAEYQVITANNGKQGLRKAAEHIPDIIVSDVMMPEMDGFEFLKLLKSNISTNHIPVVLLTARADLASKLEGLDSGAEAYLTKPFNKSELIIRLKKLLEQRALLQQRYISANMLEQRKDEKYFFEDKFMERVHEIFNQNIDNVAFGIDDLCRKLGMSRSQLYRKFKALTSIGVDKYLRKYRLHNAMKLLKTTDLNINQVALEVGISNPAYFSKAFKKEFGYSPSEVVT